MPPTAQGPGRQRRSRERVDNPVDLTSMIDVVFLLLIFFIATMQLPEPEAGLRAYLPKEDPKVEGAAEDVQERPDLAPSLDLPPRELAGVTSNLNVLVEGERGRLARYRSTLGNLAHSHFYTSDD